MNQIFAISSLLNKPNKMISLLPYNHVRMIKLNIDSVGLVDTNLNCFSANIIFKYCSLVKLGYRPPFSNFTLVPIDRPNLQSRPSRKFVAKLFPQITRGYQSLYRNYHWLWHTFFTSIILSDVLVKTPSNHFPSG